MTPANDARTVAFRPSSKYQPLIAEYAVMARDGYATGRGAHVEGGYQRQEAIRFRAELKRLFSEFSVRSVLDYGGGGGHWREKRTPEGSSFADYLGVDTYRVYEPARDIDDRAQVDCVACFDVMEHVFLADIPFALADIFAMAKSLVVFNIACYAADARLPNGENAHSTQRSPDWWRGAVATVAAAHPHVAVALYLSTSYRRIERDAVYRFADIAAAPGYAR